MKRAIASRVGIAGTAMMFAIITPGPVIGAVKVDTQAQQRFKQGDQK